MDTKTKNGPTPRDFAHGLDLEFDVTRDGNLMRLHVVVCEAGNWMESRESQQYSDSWATVLLGDGMVAAARIEPPHQDDDGWDHPDPEFTQALTQLRHRLTEWIETRDWIRSASVNFGGNGSFSIDFETTGEPISGAGPWLIIKAAPHESVR